MDSKYFIFGQLNNKKKKRSVGLIIVDVLFTLYILITISYLIFCSLFIQARVVGTSMQPTFNINLHETQDPTTSIYQDYVYAKRSDKGTNGDIVIAQVKKETVIKRIIATEGQVLTLKYESDGYYHFYLASETGAEPVKLNESYTGKYYQNMDYGYYLRFIDVEGVEKDGVLSDKSASIVIPKNKVFLVGDNRKTSEDSTTYGAIDKDCILGTVKFYHYYNQSFLEYLWQQLCSIF